VLTDLLEVDDAVLEVVDEDVSEVEDSVPEVVELDDEVASVAAVVDDDDEVVELDASEVGRLTLELDDDELEEADSVSTESVAVGFEPAPIGTRVMGMSSCGARFFIMRLRLTCSRRWTVASWASTKVVARQSATKQRSVVLEEANMSIDIVREDV
jgi:hypothetical protein